MLKNKIMDSQQGTFALTGSWYECHSSISVGMGGAGWSITHPLFKWVGQLYVLVHPLLSEAVLSWEGPFGHLGAWVKLFEY